MIDCNKIISTAEKHLEGTDMFVVGCTCTPSNDVELLIDSDTSVDIDACAALSRAVEEAFDRDEEDFSLTVASAGIGSDLKLPRQYRKLVGSSIELLLRDGVKITAHLEAADEQGIIVSYDQKVVVEGRKRRQSVRTESRYDYSELKYAREFLDFK